MSTLRGGLVGCGFWAENHLNAWNSIPDVTIAALCDIDVSKAHAYAEQFDIQKTYSAFETMLKSESLDFVDIVTQPDTHRELVELAARNGLDTICQKPFASNYADAEAMVQACRNAGVVLMIHENFRWQRPMRIVKELSAGIGEIFFGRINFRSGFDVFAVQPYLAEDPIFIIYDVGPHLFDLARYFMGEADKLYCQVNRVNPRIKAEDVATIMLRMAGGATCIVDMSYASKMEDDLFPQTLVHLEGSNGSVTLGPHYHITHVQDGETHHQTLTPETLPWGTPPFETIQKSALDIQEHWVECLRDRKQPETSGEDNLRTIEIVFGSYESAKSGLPYKVKTQ